jgi:hypothetical protein
VVINGSRKSDPFNGANVATQQLHPSSNQEHLGAARVAYANEDSGAAAPEVALARSTDGVTARATIFYG